MCLKGHCSGGIPFNETSPTFQRRVFGKGNGSQVRVQKCSPLKNNHFPLFATSGGRYIVPKEITQTPKKAIREVYFPSPSRGRRYMEKLFCLIPFRKVLARRSKLRLALQYPNFLFGALRAPQYYPLLSPDRSRRYIKIKSTKIITFFL